MQMKCFLPEPRLPLQPCTVATGSHAESLPHSGCWCVGTRDDAAAFNSGNGPEHGRYRTLELSMSGWNEVNTGSAVGAPRAARRVVWGILSLCNGRGNDPFTTAHTLQMQPQVSTVARTVVMHSKDGQWQSPCVCWRGARWSVVPLLLCRIRSLALVYE